MTTPSIADSSPLGDFLVDPMGALSGFGHALLVHGRPWAVVAVLVPAWLLLRTVLRQAHRRALAAGARQIVILAPPQADPSGGEALWANLAGLVRPWWRRAFGEQPHLAFEFAWQPEQLTVSMWVPQCVPEALVRRAIEAAWPGAHTTTRPAIPPLAELSGTRRQMTGGRLRLAHPQILPLETRHSAAPLRALLGAAVGLSKSEAACVQLLARPRSRGPAAPRCARRPVSEGRSGRQPPGRSAGLAHPPALPHHHRPLRPRARRRSPRRRREALRSSFTGFLTGGSTASAAARSNIPPRMLALYQQAAPTCPGLDWTVLAAIGKAETDHGRHPTMRSEAGAVGPMQFLPSTYAAYAYPVPLSGKNPPTPWDPVNAVHAAARMLCTNIARGGKDLNRAVFQYNHSHTGAAAAPTVLRAITFARSQIGTPYLWGGDGPHEGGFDCSGLTQAAYATAGIRLPRVAEDQYNATPQVPCGQPLLPGDLVFFGRPGNIHHVGLYIAGTAIGGAVGVIGGLFTVIGLRN